MNSPDFSWFHEFIYMVSVYYLSELNATWEWEVKNLSKVIYGLASILTLILLFNLGLQLTLASEISSQSLEIEQMYNNILEKQNPSKSEGDNFFSSIIPSGKPAIYGDELGVTFDFAKVQESINIMSSYDDLRGNEANKITFDDLTPELQKRYINIGTSISCEYCCSAKSITFQDGKTACGCAHSAAMRGLAKYLLTKHTNEYTDDQILEELTKWKTMYFPKQTIQKAAKLQGDGKEINTQLLNEIPSMVGGC